MIDIRAARVVDTMPRVLAREPWTQAFSSACGWLFGLILDYADRTLDYAGVDTMSDTVLDVMAAELNILSYSTTLPIAQKRALVKQAMPFWATAGTNGALRDMLATIFGDAEVVEWFDYAGDPFHFKITTTNPAITGDNVTAFTSAAEKVKRLSAVLDTVELLLSCDLAEYVGLYPAEYTSHHLRMAE